MVSASAGRDVEPFGTVSDMETNRNSRAGPYSSSKKDDDDTTSSQLRSTTAIHDVGHNSTRAYDSHCSMYNISTGCDKQFARKFVESKNAINRSEVSVNKTDRSVSNNESCVASHERGESRGEFEDESGGEIRGVIGGEMFVFHLSRCLAVPYTLLQTVLSDMMSDPFFVGFAVHALLEDCRMGSPTALQLVGTAGIATTTTTLVPACDNSHLRPGIEELFSSSLGHLERQFSMPAGAQVAPVVVAATAGGTAGAAAAAAAAMGLVRLQNDARANILLNVSHSRVMIDMWYWKRRAAAEGIQSAIEATAAEAAAEAVAVAAMATVTAAGVFSVLS